MLTVFIWIVGIVASVVLTIILSDPIAYAATRIVGGLGSKRNTLTGVWEACYEFENVSGVKKKNTHIFVLRQLGKFVAGKSINISDAPQFLFGKIESGLVFTGTWQEKYIKDDQSYHGAFQFCIKPNWTEMNGRWVGFNRTMVVKHGAWEWKLKSRSLKKEFLNEQKTIKMETEIIE